MSTMNEERKVIYAFGVSLDGYFAGPDGEIDWATPNEELHRFHTEQTAAPRIERPGDAAERHRVAGAVPRSPAGDGDDPRARPRGCRGGQGDDRAGVHRRDPAPSATTARP